MEYNKNFIDINLSNENYIKSNLLKTDSIHSSLLEPYYHYVQDLEHVESDDFDENLINGVSQTNSSQDYSQDCIYQFLYDKNQNFYQSSTDYNKYLENIQYNDNSEYSQIEDILYPKTKKSFRKMLKFIFCCSRY